MHTIETVFCSSLAKIMPGKDPEITISCGEALQKERYSFQLLFRCPQHREFFKIEVDSDFGKHLKIRETALVPVTYTGLKYDDNMISTRPGLFPDLLTDLPPDGWLPATPHWRSLWITVDVPSNARPGRHLIKFTLRQRDNVRFRESEEAILHLEFPLEIINAALPPQKLKNTHWFHCDCLADYYGVEIFSEEHWEIIGNFMKNAANHGINLLLTPIFTPPLDTRENAERPTVQLVDVFINKGKYSFNFDKLERWITLAQKCGIKYFEMSHLFTQWGAKFTPKIIAQVNGKEKRIFGWDAAADSPSYAKFLGTFLPELTAFIKQKKLEKRVYFHCSDEPEEGDLELYSKNQKLLSKYLRGFKIIDAMSNAEYFTAGAIPLPIPNIINLEDFIAAGVKERWTYYSCVPQNIYSCRFIHMPSARNRIFGTLLYKYQVRGFLHWGFNFYYASLSRYLIDPYRCNNSSYIYPPGDAFLVYPGKNGIPEDSIRHEVFFEALQDQRALELLEKLTDRTTAEKLVDSFAPDGTMKMNSYPGDEKSVLALRHQINQLIKQQIG